MEKLGKKSLLFILVLFLLGAAIFSLFKYIVTLKEKRALSLDLNQAKTQVATLEGEKTNLLNTLEEKKQLVQKLKEENFGLQSHLQKNRERLAKLDSDFKDAQKAIEQLSVQAAGLKSENIALKEEKTGLGNQLSQAAQERDILKVRFNSVEELKKAIRELRHKVTLRPKTVREVRIKERIKETIDNNKEGNLGFIVKDGKSTYSRIKIEISPLPLDQ